MSGDRPVVGAVPATSSAATPGVATGAGGALRVFVQGIGLLGPGIDHWDGALAAWRDARPHERRPTVLPVAARLPPAERRRAGAAVKLALAVADQAVAQSRVDPATLATVFTSSSGEGINCHALCETLATPTPMVSPIRFTNSVHNAAAGCWHIAVGSRASSTSLCAFDGSFAAGLLDAAVNVQRSGRPVLLVASDSPYPEPLNGVRPLPDHFGVALLLSPVADASSLAGLTIAMDGGAAITACADTSLEVLREAIPAARGLPLLAAIASLGQPGATAQTLALAYLHGLNLRITVAAPPSVR